jgi:hypothetical protein
VRGTVRERVVRTVSSVEHNPTTGGGTVSVHYKHDGIATFDAPVETIFRYMSEDNHHHAAFKSHDLVGVADNVVTVTAEVYNPDGSTFTTTIKHILDPPRASRPR